MVRICSKILTSGQKLGNQETSDICSWQGTERLQEAVARQERNSIRLGDQGNEEEVGGWSQR